ncbi:MAG: M18 family aminopeptidase, partial [Clostridia bacterium]|nr:M18 family aminopeptidase [Clostridia bacterium]
MKVLDFLKNSYTAYHATHNVCQILEQNGFVELTLGEKWSIDEGGKYFVTRNGSSVIAFVVGEHKVLSICESHTDSPSFKVKGTKLVASEGAKRLNTEKYGGGLLYTYFDRPLKIAGRVLEKGANGVQQKLVASDYNVVIPSLCVHLNPTANDSFAVNPQVDTLALLSQSEVDLYKTLTDGEVLDADLYVVPTTEPFLAGVQNEFLCAPRIDNLTSVYTSIQALLNCNPQTIAMAVCLDNEEVGSGTRQGN